jgi:hypothetical protein
MDEEKLLSEAELLEALNIKVDRTAVWRWRKKGMPHMKVGKANRYDLSAVREWLEKHSREDLQAYRPAKEGLTLEEAQEIARTVMGGRGLGSEIKRKGGKEVLYLTFEVGALYNSGGEQIRPAGLVTLAIRDGYLVEPDASNGGETNG